MRLVEQHIIKPNHRFFKECDTICFKTKNLYNYALYITRQRFFETNQLISANDLRKQLASNNQIDFRALTSQVSKEVLRSLDKNWKSYFTGLKSYKKNPIRFKDKPKLPNYKDKIKGRFLAEYYNPEAVSQKFIKQDVIRLSQTSIELPRKGRIVKVVRVIPKYG